MSVCVCVALSMLGVITWLARFDTFTLSPQPFDLRVK